MTYCGLWIKFTPAGRAAIQTEVDKLTENMVAHAALTEKANTYFPIIYEAFDYVGAPHDLAYIVLQESGLRGDAVSPSNAVGFWQMKDYTAKEVGLRIDLNIDERKHIYRSSVGAAQYFYKNRVRFDNWLYSVIAYYAGGTGSLPYIDSLMFGANEMLIDENLHWYAKKAIAHKIAFQDYIGKDQPKVWLEPHSNNGALEVEKIILEHNITKEEFKKYNLWAINGTIPEDRPISYYIPRTGPPQYAQDPHYDFVKSPGPYKPKKFYVSGQYKPYHNTPPPPKQQPQTWPGNTATAPGTPAPNPNAPAPADQTAVVKPAPKPPVLEPETKPVPPPLQSSYPGLYGANGLPVLPQGYEMRSFDVEPLRGKQFAILQPGETIESLATLYMLKAKNLRTYNLLDKSDQPQKGSVVYLVPPHKADIHIARAGETMLDVSLHHDKPVWHLLFLNGLKSEHEPLYPGQKVYLTYARPEKEPHIVYVPNEYLAQPEPAAPAVAQADPTPQPEAVPQPAVVDTAAALPDVALPEVPQYFENYTVQKGDTLYGIASKFNVDLHYLRIVNGMKSGDLIEVGEVLRIPMY